ncbi:MAG: 16S rRNA (cytidine(1402)-2'-O)-methyltransferase [Eggerthellaceae bacterium]|nr:16S rRNA (cytidine(1402)-2'-O)-methyltransferase [Eggerthellaceae bacterium]
MTDERRDGYGETGRGRIILVPTPIGNLGDMTRRGIEAFSAADVVCCEDTRVTGKLLAALGISKRLERLDEAAISVRAGEIVARAAAGEIIAFASDAGMPGVSDPGGRLVAAAREAGVPVEVLPGASAAATAYVAAGFACPRYYFGGFFPRKAGERRSVLESLKALDAVLVFYESPNRIADALAVVAQVLPHRQVAVCRELTKLHEEVFRAPAPDAAAEFARREAAEGIRGEIVLVIDGLGEAEAASDAERALAAAEVRAAQLRATGASAKDIRTLLIGEFGLSRNDAYALALGK